MRVLGIDPGSAHVGVCVLDVQPDATAKWVHAETLTPVDITLDSAAELVPVHQADLVAVEMPVPRRMSVLKELLLTIRIAERFLNASQVAGCERIEISAYDWRKRLCDNHVAKNAIIKLALEQFVDVPRSNVHTRDACGVALVAGWDLFDGRLVA